MMCLSVSYKKKYEEKNFKPLKSMKKINRRSGSNIQRYGTGDLDRIRTKMSQIPKKWKKIQVNDFICVINYYFWEYFP